MLAIARQRLQKDDEDGFTLIELMVVVLIIAILLAIAIPTFLGAQDRARDRAAQSDLRNAVTAAKTIATDSAGLFSKAAVAPATVPTGVTMDEIRAAEGALTYVSGAPADAVAGNVGTVVVTGGASVAPGNPDLMQFTTQSASGETFSMAISSKGRVSFCNWAVPADIKVATVASDGTLGVCIGTKF